MYVYYVHKWIIPSFAVVQITPKESIKIAELKLKIPILLPKLELTSGCSELAFILNGSESQSTSEHICTLYEHY